MARAPVCAFVSAQKRNYESECVKGQRARHAVLVSQRLGSGVITLPSISSNAPLRSSLEVATLVRLYRGTCKFRLIGDAPFAFSRAPADGADGTDAKKCEPMRQVLVAQDTLD